MKIDVEAYLPDAEAYAKAFNVDVDEALRRLLLQDKIAALNTLLQSKESSTFAGLWIEHTPTFRVVVQLTQGNKDSILKYVQDPQIAAVVDVTYAAHSQESLTATHDKVMQIADMLKLPIESGTVLQKNRVEVYVTDRSGFEDALLKANQQLPDNVDIVEVSALARPEQNWYGGNFLASCTTGFSLRNGAGTKFSSSAGHCPAAAVVPLTFYASFYSGAYDFGVLTLPSGDVAKNWAADSDGSAPTPYYREITGYTLNAPVGSAMCKYGKTTFFTCGTIEQNNYNYRGSATWYLVKSTSTTQKISCPGDSGAAWFSGNYAYATDSAGWCDLSINKAVVMPVARMIDKGYYPMTTP